MFPLLHEPDKCPGCGAPGLRGLHVYRNKEQRVIKRSWLGLFGCERCGLVSTHPQPSEEELDAYYGSVGGWEARASGDDDFASGSELEEKLARKRSHYERELQLLKPHLDNAKRVLDFGCGLGTWLDVLADEGWETWGIEPGPAQAEVAAARHRIVADIPTDAAFDLVLVNHVAEHLPDPRRSSSH